MTITEKEIREDFARFIRHEAMRANCTQEEVRQIITGGNEYPIKVVSGKIDHKEGDKSIYEWCILTDLWLFNVGKIRLKIEPPF